MSWKGLTGEPLALDLVNTVAGTAHGDVELLDSADAMREWLEIQRDRLTLSSGDGAGGGGDTDIDIEAVRTLRGEIASLVRAAWEGGAPSRSGLAALTAAQRAAPAYTEPLWDGAALTAVQRRDGSATAVLLADLAAAAVELLADPGVTTIRECEGPNCHQIFLPTNPRRRWCRPAVCGNRARVARYYETHKG
jgi:predicted RNA-binding Zn ribbon-like protein